MRKLIEYVDHGVKYGTTFIKNVMTLPASFTKIEIKGCSQKAIGSTHLFKRHIWGSKTADQDRNTFYLKVYRDDDIAIACVRNWLEVINCFENPDVYIVCDNLYLKLEILHKCCFPDLGDVTFIKSRERAIKGLCENLHSKSLRWRNATYAHVIPFYHARKNRIKHHWDLDADDTMFLISPELTAKALKAAERTAKLNQIDAFSLDMWWSRTQGKYWTFGVLYISGHKDFYDFFEKNQNKSWMKRYEEKKLEKYYNTDWYFTYLKEERLAKIETFYIENSFFSHWGANCLFNPIYGALYRWKEGKLTYPIIDKFYQDDFLAENEIIDCIKIDIGLDGQESSSFLRNKFGNISDYERHRFGLSDAENKRG